MPHTYNTTNKTKCTTNHIKIKTITSFQIHQTKQQHNLRKILKIKNTILTRPTLKHKNRLKNPKTNTKQMINLNNITQKKPNKKHTQFKQTNSYPPKDKRGINILKNQAQQTKINPLNEARPTGLALSKITKKEQNTIQQDKTTQKNTTPPNNIGHPPRYYTHLKKRPIKLKNTIKKTNKLQQTRPKDHILNEYKKKPHQSTKSSNHLNKTKQEKQHKITQAKQTQNITITYTSHITKLIHKQTHNSKHWDIIKINNTNQARKNKHTHNQISYKEKLAQTTNPHNKINPPPSITSQNTKKTYYNIKFAQNT